MSLITVREFARLSTAQTHPHSLDEATVSPAAFDWLCKESARLRPSGAVILELEDRQSLRLDNYIGVLEAPDGTRIEILPKAFDQAGDAPAARRLLRKMLQTCMNVRPRESSVTALQTGSAPVNEWIFQQFVTELDWLLKHGLKFDYQRVQEEQKFLRGRLNLARQVRQPPGRQHVFQIEHDIFSADRPENRLLKSALLEVCRLTRDSDTWRWSHQLAAMMHEVPHSPNVRDDLAKWNDGRLLEAYRSIKPWCVLILHRLVPLSMVGTWMGPSLLFPMEVLFERYVSAQLARQIGGLARLHPTPSSKFLCRHEGENMFKLKPDFAILHSNRLLAILDTKWKQIDESLSNATDKYSLRQADFYQMHAYGHRYLNGTGVLALIFPKTALFRSPLPAFQFSDELALHVLPFDLETDQLVGLERVLPSAAQLPDFA